MYRWNECLNFIKIDILSISNISYVHFRFKNIIYFNSLEVRNFLPDITMSILDYIML